MKTKTLIPFLALTLVLMPEQSAAQAITKVAASAA
jgi:hypothetical protein